MNKKRRKINRILTNPFMKGEDLRNLRETFGWTQFQVATILGVDQSQISRWETRSEYVPNMARKLLQDHCDVVREKYGV